MSNDSFQDLQGVTVHSGVRESPSMNRKGTSDIESPYGSPPYATSSPYGSPPMARASSSLLGTLNSAGDIHIPMATFTPFSPFNAGPSGGTPALQTVQEGSSLDHGESEGGRPSNFGMKTPFSHGDSMVSPWDKLETLPEDSEGEEKDIGRLVNEYLEEEKEEKEQLRFIAEAEKKLLMGNRLASFLSWTKTFTKGFLYVAWSVIFLFIGITMKLEEDNREWLFLPVWRVCILLGCIPVVRFLPSHAMFIVIFIMENQMVSKNGGVLVYYLMSIRRHAVSLLRCVFGLAIFHFFVAHDVKKEFEKWELLIAKGWICVALVYFGNVLKALLARSLSRHFHTKAYFERMQEAVQNEYYLMALLKPRGTQLLPTLLGADAPLSKLNALSTMFRRKEEFKPGRANQAQTLNASEGPMRVSSNPLERSGVTRGGDGYLPMVNVDIQLLSALDLNTGKLSPRGSMAMMSLMRAGSMASTPTGCRSKRQSADMRRNRRYSGGGGAASEKGSSGSTTPNRRSFAGAGSIPFIKVSNSGMPPQGPGRRASMAALARKGSAGGSSVGGATTYGRRASAEVEMGFGVGTFTSPRQDGRASNDSSLRAGEAQSSKEDYPLLAEMASSNGKPAYKSPFSDAYQPPFSDLPFSDSVGGRCSTEGGTRSFWHNVLKRLSVLGAVVKLPFVKIGAWMSRIHTDYESTVLLSSYAGKTDDVVTVVGPGGAHLAFAADVAADAAAERQAARQGGTLRNAPTMLPGGGEGPQATLLAAPAAAATDGEKGQNLEMSLYWLEKHIRNNKLKYVTLTDQLVMAAEAQDGQGSEISSKVEAKRLAFSLYWNVMGMNLQRSYVSPEDLLHFFDFPEEALACFNILDQDGDGKVTLSEIVDVIVKVYKERKKLALSLKDTKSVVAKLELVCGVIIQTMFVLLYLWIFNVNIGNLWVSISTFCLAFVFVFGNSLRTLYESVLFLFVIHPFDVGDWLQLSCGEICKVEGIDLMAITALKSNGRRLYIPINRLMSDIIQNYSRSEHMWDTCAMLVDLDTPSSVLKHVEMRMKEHANRNPKEYCTNEDSVAVIARSLEDPKKLKWLAYWELTHVAEDVGRSFEWRSRMICAAQDALNECGITYCAAPEAPYELKRGMKPYELPEQERVDLASQQYLFARTGVLLSQEREQEGRREEEGSGSGTGGLMRARGFPSYNSAANRRK